MQPSATTETSAGTSTFAGMLAALATPVQKRQLAWHDEDLADDVATLSYERALRAHGRYKAPEPSDPPLTHPEHAGSLRIYEALPEALRDEVERPAQAPTAQPAIRPPAVSNAHLYGVPAPKAAQEASNPADRNLKSASITIRLSRAECAQLRKRAAEAGLTVSAYLRSCTFEAETLRALVKDTLAQLRSTSNRENQANSVPARHGWRQWLARFWPRLRSTQRTVQA